MAVLKVGGSSVGKISVIQPYDDPLGKFTEYYKLDNGDWSRPSDWLTMPSGDNTVAALIFVPSGCNDLTVSLHARGVSATNSNNPTYIPVDWGDNTSSIFYGTRVDNGSADGYFYHQHKMYDYDLLSPSTEIEVNGITSRQALIVLDGSISGIGYFNVLSLAGEPFGYQTRRTGDVSYYEYTDTSGTVRDVPPRSGFRYNNHSSTMLELYASGASITGCRISEDQAHGRHRFLHKAYLNISHLGEDLDHFIYSDELREVYFPSGATAGKTDLRNMFHSCWKLKEVPFFDTSSATNMQGTFNGCRSLTYIPEYDTSNVLTFEGCFARCYNLSSIPDHLDFSSATNLNTVFYQNHQLTHVPSGFNTVNATGLSHAFYQCYNLTAIPKLDLSSATYIHGMFRECDSIRTPVEIDAPNLILNNSSASYVFQNCYQLEEIHIKNVGSARNFDNMFTGCVNLRKLTWDNASGLKPTGIHSMFNNCRKNRYTPEFDLSECINTSYAFSNNRSLLTTYTYDLSSATSCAYMFHYCMNLKSAKFKNVTQQPNCDGMFSYCDHLISISGFFEGQGSTPSFMRSMFYQDRMLEDVSNFVISGSTNTSTNNQNTFGGCISLKKLPKEINTEYGCINMFNSIHSITATPAYDLSASTNSAGMFNYCHSLRAVNVSGINSDIGFYDCYLGSGELTKLFNKLETVSSATIDVRHNHGVSELHSDSISIATNKGWTVLTA